MKWGRRIQELFIEDTEGLAYVSLEFQKEGWEKQNKTNTYVHIYMYNFKKKYWPQQKKGLVNLKTG